MLASPCRPAAVHCRELKFTTLIKMLAATGPASRRTWSARAVASLLALALPSSFSAQSPPLLPKFRDIRELAGIHFRHDGSPTNQKYLIEAMGGGVAVADFNGDGLLDIFLVNSGWIAGLGANAANFNRHDPHYWNRLYFQNLDGTFTDVTEHAGLANAGDGNYGMGAAVGDYDNDGFPDLYVTSYGRNILYHNNHDGTFTDVTNTAGVAAGGWSTSAGFFDYDNDGYLDLFVTRYMKWGFDRNPFCGDPLSGFRGYCHPDKFPAVTNILYHNNHDGTFSDVSEVSGVAALPGRGLGVAFNDYDGDGRADVFVANDSMEQFLLHNDGGGKFSERALAAGAAFNADGSAFAGMGVDFADYDNDGLADIAITDLSNERYALYHNEGGGAFRYATSETGLGRITLYSSGWGTHFLDYDNDGRKDLFVAQSHVMDNIQQLHPSIPYRMPLLLARNTGKEFANVSADSGAPFQISLAGRGAAFGDLDNDGNVDVVVAVLNDSPLVLHNEGGTGNHWLSINTVGTRSNRDGQGARIKITGESGQAQFGYVTTAGSYLSASDKRVHFGLGQDKTIATIEVIWPSGLVQKLTNVPADQAITITEPTTGAHKP